jgi:hypothetical protein
MKEPGNPKELNPQRPRIDIFICECMVVSDKEETIVTDMLSWLPEPLNRNYHLPGWMG